MAKYTELLDTVRTKLGIVELISVPLVNRSLNNFMHNSVMQNNFAGVLCAQEKAQSNFLPAFIPPLDDDCLRFHWQ